MKNTERVVMVLILLIIIGGGGWIYQRVSVERDEVREAVRRGEYEVRTYSEAVSGDENTPEDWKEIYPETVPIKIGQVTVEASVADSLAERMRGLSETPFLPEGVIKLFVFGVGGPQSIWMKDMQYPLDIIWLSKQGVVVHIVTDVSPDSYPESFSSPQEAWYVIEANAGFVEDNQIKKDMIVDLSGIGE